MCSLKACFQYFSRLPSQRKAKLPSALPVLQKHASSPLHPEWSTDIPWAKLVLEALPSLNQLFNYCRAGGKNIQGIKRASNIMPQAISGLLGKGTRWQETFLLCTNYRTNFRAVTKSLVWPRVATICHRTEMLTLEVSRTQQCTFAYIQHLWLSCSFYRNR